MKRQISYIHALGDPFGYHQLLSSDSLPTGRGWNTYLSSCFFYGRTHSSQRRSVHWSRPQSIRGVTWRVMPPVSRVFYPWRYLRGRQRARPYFSWLDGRWLQLSLRCPTVLIIFCDHILLPFMGHRNTAHLKSLLSQLPCYCTHACRNFQLWQDIVYAYM